MAEIPVTLSLAQDGERVHGILVYQRIGNDIAIDGQITPDGTVTLTETGAAGKRTGQWARSGCRSRRHRPGWSGAGTILPAAATGPCGLTAGHLWPPNRSAYAPISPGEFSVANRNRGR